MSTFLKSQKAFLLALDPLRQISADLNKAKDVLALIQEIVNNNNNTTTTTTNNNNNNNNNNDNNNNDDDDDDDFIPVYSMLNWLYVWSN